MVLACGGNDSTSSSPPSGAPNAQQTVPTVVPTQNAANAKRGGTLNLLWDVADAHLDPHSSTQHMSAELWRAVSHGLLKQETVSMLPKPDLATKWEQVDKLTYIFHLDPAAKWQGRDPVTANPVTAEDVVYSLKRIATPGPAAPRASSFSAIESFTATDPRTVTIKLKEPFVPILSALSDKWTVIVPRQAVEKFGDLKRAEALIGCGPFICQTADPAKGATLVRNPDYWKPNLPYLDRVVYTTVLDDEARAAAFRSGQADVSFVLPDLTLNTFRSNDVELLGFPQNWFVVSVLGGPNDKRPLNDERVRRAINLAVDREALGQVAWPGADTRTAGVFENEFWGVPVDEVAKTPGFGKKTDAEIREAKALIDAAGATGAELVINTTRQYPAVYIDRAEAVVPMLAKIGLNAKLNVLEFAALKDFEVKKDFQFTVGSFAAYGDPDAPLFNSFSTTGTRNYWNWSDPAYDALVKRQREEENPDRRKQLVIEAQKLLMKGTPVAHSAWYHKSYVGVRKKVKNFQGINGVGSSTQGWFLAEMWLDG